MRNDRAGGLWSVHDLIDGESTGEGALLSSARDRGVRVCSRTLRWVSLATAVLAAIAITGCGEEGLSESSTCKEFLAADPADQQSITQQLAGKFGKPDYATPLGMPAVPYYCAKRPDTTLQEFFESAG